MKKFTFKYTTSFLHLDSPSDLESKLNEYGELGWEVVGIYEQHLFIFKRKIETYLDTGPS